MNAPTIPSERMSAMPTAAGRSMSGIGGHWYLMPVVLAGVAPFLRFAAENVRDRPSIPWLTAYAALLVGMSIALTLMFRAFGRGAMIRGALAVSVFVFLFFN